MQTQQPDSETIKTLPASSTRPPRRSRRWLTGLGALLVVGVVIASSVVVFSLAGRGHGNQGNGQTPLEGQWKAVQQGYLFLSIKAATNDPAVLYACATTSAAISNQGAAGVVTILRSVDNGDTWQNIGANLLQGSTCLLTLNPANSDDVYVFSTANTAQATTVLYHSTDGGKTWQTFQPMLSSKSVPAVQHLFLQQLAFAGNDLLAIDWNVSPIPPVKSPRATPLILARLVRSVDGGRSWTIIDSQFTNQGLSTQGFAVDPSQPDTIYELLGHPLLPVQTVPPSGSVVPPYGINQQLYKTTDGGANWTLALAQVSYGAQVQIASNDPSIVYVGGVLGPVPLIAQGATGGPNTGSSSGPTLPTAIGGFHLQISRDGGASWKTVATPPDQEGILNWFASPDGHVIASPTTPFVEPGTVGTGVVGTAVVGTAVAPAPPCCKPAATPQGGSGHPPLNGTPAGVIVNGSGPYSSTDVSPSPGSSSIVSYDPASNSWSKVTPPPESGEMLTVTFGSNDETTLWFMGVGTTGTRYTLYRYIV